MSIEQHIEDIINPALLDKGFRSVRVQLQDSKRKILQIMIERVDGRSITIEDCTFVSNTVSTLLDIDDPIHTPYILEVSSPGLDRPLVKREDFERFAGSMIKVELKTPHEGSRRFQGILQGLNGDFVKIELIIPDHEKQNESVEFVLSNIQKAKIVPKYDAS